jgi:hypothetical protein
MDKRNFPRTSMVSDYSTQFHLGGQTYSKIQVANIGTHGCCLQMPIGSAKYLKDKPVLDNMILFHSDTKKYSLRGKVAWCDETPANKGSWITAGIEFLDTPEDCTREISEYVIATIPK